MTDTPKPLSLDEKLAQARQWIDQRFGPRDERDWIAREHSRIRQQYMESKTWDRT